jgi:hypothetical protein
MDRHTPLIIVVAAVIRIISRPGTSADFLQSEPPLFPDLKEWLF